MHVTPGERELNLTRAIDFISKASAAGADLILLPEALPFGWTHPSAERSATEIPNGSDFLALSTAARQCRIYVCCGLVERSGNRLFNSAVLISPEGSLLLHHRKINELAFAHDLYSQGDQMGVCDTPLGRIGLMICADAFIQGQVISRTLGQMGAQVILSPCAWAVPPEHDNHSTPYGELWMQNYQPVCKEFGLWIAGCSNVGPIVSGTWAGHKCIGNSLVINPEGKISCTGSFGMSAEELITLPVAPKALKRPRGDA